MLETIQAFPLQFKKSLVETESCDLSSHKTKNFQEIIVAAMGGSSLPTDLVNAYLFPNLFVKTLRDYHIKGHVTEKSLVICSSFSGDTEETLSVFEQCLEQNIACIAMSNGGQLKEKAFENKVPYIHIPDCIQPRCATGHFFASEISLLSQLGIIENKNAEIESLADFLESEKSRQEETGKALAKELKGRLPIIYSDNQFYAAARIWKIKLNENAKIQSWFNVFPELNHNEMVGYTQMNTQTSIVYLEHEGISERNNKRMDVMAGLFKNKVPIHRVQSKGSSFLERIFDAVLIGDYCSYYLALEYGVDPTPVDLVEDFKKML